MRVLFTQATTPSAHREKRARQRFFRSIAAQRAGHGDANCMNCIFAAQFCPAGHQQKPANKK
jgi:hypothetical protein